MFSTFKLYFIGAAVIGILTLAAVMYLKGSHDTRVSIEAKKNEQRLEDIGKAKKIENKIRGLPRTDVDRGLDEWMRD